MTVIQAVNVNISTITDGTFISICIGHDESTITVTSGGMRTMCLFRESLILQFTDLTLLMAFFKSKCF